MLKLVPEASFAAKAYIPIPGQEKDAVITVRFKFLEKEALQTYFESLAGREDGDALTEIVVGWEGVDKPFSAENLRTLLAGYPMAALAFFEAFRSEILKAKSGN